jgi:hypothetical protein
VLHGLEACALSRMLFCRPATPRLGLRVALFGSPQRVALSVVDSRLSHCRLSIAAVIPPHALMLWPPPLSQSPSNTWSLSVDPGASRGCFWAGGSTDEMAAS